MFQIINNNSNHISGLIQLYFGGNLLGVVAAVLENLLGAFFARYGNTVVRKTMPRFISYRLGRCRRRLRVKKITSTGCCSWNFDRVRWKRERKSNEESGKHNKQLPSVAVAAAKLETIRDSLLRRSRLSSLTNYTGLSNDKLDRRRIIFISEKT